jgi:hypothetical protein
MDTPPPRIVLRNLTLATRLTLAAFLVSLGIGYCSALVQLHFQHAKPGSALPSADDAVTAFHGSPGVSQLERLLLADEGKPFNRQAAGRVPAAAGKTSADPRTAPVPQTR